LAIRHIEGVIALARTDLVMRPPAHAATRAAVESSVRAAWLVNTEDPFDREKRWVAHLASEEDYLRREIREREALGVDVAASSAWCQQISKFRQGVSSLLAGRGYSTDAHLPNFRECLRSLDEERIYGFYSMLCQTSHATHASTWLYRSGGVGTKRIDREFISAEQWDVPLALCRFVFKVPAMTVLTRLGGDATRLAALVGSGE
jgi:hypothetical protein